MASGAPSERANSKANLLTEGINNLISNESLNNIVSLCSFCNEYILHRLEIGNLLEFIVEAEERDLNSYFNLPDPNPPPPN
eukprot:Pgem_evm1s19322